MFDVIEKESGNIVKVYNAYKDKFVVATADGFAVRNITDFAPFMRVDTGGAYEQTPCMFSTVNSESFGLGTLLDGIALGEVYVDLGDSISIKLLDGTEVELVVTDQDDKTVRLESRDCLGINTSADDLKDYLGRIYNLLPFELKARILTVERKHRSRDGELHTEQAELFVPAASEIFPREILLKNSISDEYQQLDWYKRDRNCKRANRKDGCDWWYWTSSDSQNEIEDSVIVCTSGELGSTASDNPYGCAPICCKIAKNGKSVPYS